MANDANPNHPTPPENLDGEALLEWHRLLDEMEAAGRPADQLCRSTLVQYVQAWAVAQANYHYVELLGAVVRWPNKVPGPSPFTKVWIETSKLCDKLRTSLGLVPLAGGSGKPTESDELEI